MYSGTTLPFVSFVCTFPRLWSLPLARSFLPLVRVCTPNREHFLPYYLPFLLANSPTTSSFVLRDSVSSSMSLDPRLTISRRLKPLICRVCPCYSSSVLDEPTSLEKGSIRSLWSGGVPLFTLRKTSVGPKVFVPLLLDLSSSLTGFPCVV